MRFSNPNKKKKVTIATVGLFLILSVGVMSFFIFFPHLLNKQWLINVQYLEDGSNQRIVTLYQEISNTEDGSYLKGYWVYINEASTGKEIDKIFIKRTNQHNNIPPVPDLFCVHNEIWLVGDKGMYQGEVGFLTLIQLSNHKLVLAPTTFLNDWTIQSKYVYNNTLSVVNKHNETGCLDMATHTVDANCAYIEDSGNTSNSCFFFLRNTPTSTRGHLYFYKSKLPLPAPGVFAGYIQEGQVIPGWHLIDLIHMQRGFIAKTDLEAYTSQFDTSETVSPIYEKELLDNPNIIFSDENICVLTATNEQNSSYYFYQFTSTGQLVWKVECPPLKSQTFGYGFHCLYKSQETIITHTMNWVISIDNQTGKIKWQYPK